MITLNELTERKRPLAVVGLGYVGLPLAVAFAGHCNVIGLDVNAARIAELREGRDHTREVEAAVLREAKICYTADPAELAQAGVIIVAVPTPIDSHRNPDLRPVLGASATVGRHMSGGSVIVYESTVYPGLTEEICLPILEKESGLKLGRDFALGYSPERINPGDKVHTLASIVKIVAASDASVADLLAGLYGLVVKAGVHKASGIRVAEAAKVIENTQRDLNIALMNEFAIIFQRMGIDTLDVLEAAGTKWNFLPFRPGLVGGHCIGVDPYYLTFKAEELGYHPQVILAGRRINDGMGKYLAETAVKQLIRMGVRVGTAKVGILGFTFKEDVPDLRNTRVIDMVRELEEYGVSVVVHDPEAAPEEALHEYGQTLSPLEELQDLDALILAVPHKAYRSLSPADLRARFARPDRALLMDVKGFFGREALAEAGISLWRL
ncbi:MAG: nucleotide sugar dehydrogenase [Deltaproteobacteria bacterium]|jgi:UDP-N-acetyl-D-galactosamine dehydrogenase|nr:nucleotide sugar dehydrogenase [Deltaproteobacteria bacterium]